MATESRRPGASVRDILVNETYRFDFFQAVRLLKLALPKRREVGKTAKPGDEIVRFRSHDGLSFPPSAIYQLQPSPTEDKPMAMTVAFMGLTGPSGVLPRHYTELLLERKHHKDTGLRDFFDLFNHRLISLFYRAWEKYHYAVGYETSLLEETEDRVSQYLFALMGVGTPAIQTQLHLKRQSLLRYVGLVGQRPHSAEALQHGLSDYFGVPVRVEQFLGAWLELAEQDWSRLGAAPGNRLGQTAVAGTRVWDQQARFRVVLGAMDIQTFRKLLPSGAAYSSLVDFVRFFAGLEADFDIQLKLKANDVPYCRLEASPEAAPRLGWTSWLKTHEFVQDAEDVVCVAGPVGHA
jgi:type VI secretion system protein ImpH